ncbi:hypothetical protein HDV05_004495 [Chytridiales sp. JEL 0842]|nr:hypothetical protein HDV05_004495 [Chytridiales sp. JEL 0842]
MKTTTTNSTSRKKKKEDSSWTPPVYLERVLGLSTQRSSALAIHPSPEVPLIAYPTGGFVTVYNHRRNRQVAFLVAASASASGGFPAQNVPPPVDNQVSSAMPIPIAAMASGALPQSSSGKKLPAGAGVKTISCVAFSPDGEYIAAGETGHQPRVIIWDYKKGVIVSELVGHKFGVLAAYFTPNMKYVVSVGYQHDGFVYVWNWRNGQKLACNRISAKIHSLCLDDSGTFFVTAGFRHFKFWNFDSAGILPKPTKSAPILANHKTPLQLIEGQFGTVGEHKNSTFVDAKSFRGADGAVHTYAITEKGILVYFNEERIMEKWVDLKMTTNFKELPDGNHRNHDQLDLTSPAIVDPAMPPLPPPTGLPPNTFITHSSDGTIRFWNIDANITQSTPQLDSPEYNIGSFFRRNIYSRELLKILYVGDLCLDKMKRSLAEENVERPNTDKAGIRSLRLSSDGKFMASGDRLGNIRIHELDTFTEIHFMEAHEAEILAVDFSNFRMSDDPTRPYLMATASRDRLIHIFDVRRKFELIQTLEDHSSSITAVKFAESGSKLISSAADKSIVFRSLHEAPGHYPEFSSYHNAIGRATVYDVDVDVSQKLLATVSQDRRLNIYSIASGKPVRSYRPDPVDDPGFEGSSTGGLIKVSLDSTGRFAVTAAADKCIRVFDIVTGTCVARVVGHSELITSVRFTPDLSRIISTGGDGCILVWRLSSDMTKTMKDRKGGSSAVARSQFEAGLKKLRSLQDSASVSVEDEMADSNSTLLTDASRGPSFELKYNEEDLPKWARKPSSSSEASETEVKKVIPSKGPWALRISEEGISLYSELSESERPVAKLTDMFSRRFSIEVSSGSPTTTSPTTGDQSSSQAVENVPTPPATTAKDEIVVVDVESSENEASTREGIDKVATEVDPDAAQENDEGGTESDTDPIDIDSQLETEDTEAIIFTDPADAVDEPATSFVIAEEPKVESNTESPKPSADVSLGEVSPDTSKALTEVLEAAEANADDTDVLSSTSDKFVDPSGNNLSLEEYLLQPIDLPSVRQSISAKHLATRRKPAIDGDVGMLSEGSKPSDSVFNEETEMEPEDCEETVTPQNVVKPEMISIKPLVKPFEKEPVNGIASNENSEEIPEVIHEEDVANSALEETLASLKNLKTFVDTAGTLLDEMGPASSSKESQTIAREIRTTLKLIIDSCQSALGGEPADLSNKRTEDMLEKYSNMLVSLVGKKLSTQ